MRNTLARGEALRARRMPKELGVIGGFAVAVFAVVATGSMIAAALPQPPSLWLLASAYLAPASMAFAVYWWVAQRH